jgi:thymidylate synthase (FAD)
MALRVNLLNWTGSIYPMYYAARTCTKAPRKRPAQTEMESWLQEHVINPGHMSVLEFVDFHFLISGGSRTFQQQLTRHRLSSYCIESQRTVNYENGFDFVTPPAVSKNPVAAAVYKAVMEQAKESYGLLLAQGIKPEDARMLLPQAITGEINFKCNGRELISIAHERLCTKAQWEIRQMFKQIVELLDDICPLISGNMVPKCRFLGRCPEGARSCRKG